jgi:hypothetical protein
VLHPQLSDSCVSKWMVHLSLEGGFLLSVRIRQKNLFKKKSDLNRKKIQKKIKSQLFCHEND